MDRISLKATERETLGKKVAKIRQGGFLPGHVFGKDTGGENVSVNAKEFSHVFSQAGETGLVDLKIGDEKVRPVLIRGLQHDPYTGEILNIDFYQVNLKEKVTVPVPVVLIGEEPESVHLGEAVVLQPINELQVEALPTDFVENIEVDISFLKEIGDAITVADLKYDREKLTVLAEPEDVVVKLDTAVTEEMKKLMEEQEAEAAAAAEAQGAEEGAEEKAEGGEGEEAAEGEEGEASEGGEKEDQSEQSSE